MSKDITIYTRTTCAYCVNVKKYLDMKNQAYKVINLDEQPALADEIIAKSGARTVPVVVVRDEAKDTEDITVGWNPGKLAAALV
ncbi:MAG TPA: glutaredoxin family protein [Candidatus Saccharimonadales bacterium]|nr:glutaredoxin family protein [Candidatus Saccharimonadales bacterium]